MSNESDINCGHQAETSNPNPLLQAQNDFLASVPLNVRRDFFSTESVDPAVRADVWSRQADLGERLVNECAWATPDDQALAILRHFSPIVEVGCGANAYWARMMHAAGIDVVAYDAALCSGGRIHSNHDVGAKIPAGGKVGTASNDVKETDGGFQIRIGGPDVLSSVPTISDSNRALFLCYPDEEDSVAEKEGDSYDPAPVSMGAACLEHFAGDTVIHVGELYGDTLSLDQAPWGRSSSSEFQQRLAAEYHCILKAGLTNWLHVRDTISVWKRTQRCSIVFQGEDENDSDEEVEYRHIPQNERLPVDIAAPAVAHLLSNGGKLTEGGVLEAEGLEHKKNMKSLDKKRRLDEEIQ